jgi:putative transposase
MYLVKTKPNTIVIEDLNVEGMKHNRKLAKAISDAGFGEFRRQLEYKCKWYNINLYVVGRWFPSSKTCNCCGNIKENLKLSDRIYKCECGYIEDRDLNASYNIRDYYLHSLQQ